jgi:hypothetical protein
MGEGVLKLARLFSNIVHPQPLAAKGGERMGSAGYSGKNELTSKLLHP